MYLKILLVLLSSLLLVQSSMGNAIPAFEETEVSVEKLHAQFLNYVIKKLMDIAESILKSSKVVLQDVVDEISTLENNNEEVTELVEKANNLITDIKALDTKGDLEEMPDVFSFMDTLEQLIGRFSKTEDARKGPIVVNKIFHESVKKHGLSDLKKEYENKLQEFSNDFITESNKIVEATTLEDWPEKNKFIDLLKKFKAEKDIDKKSDMFADFIDFL